MHAKFKIFARCRIERANSGKAVCKKRRATGIKRRFSPLFSLQFLQFEQVEGEGWGFDRQPREAVMEIESFGGGRNHVDDHEPGGDLRPRTERAAHDIGEQRSSQALALPCAIDRQPAERHRRNLFRHIPAHGASNILREDLSHAQREIADDLA